MTVAPNRAPLFRRILGQDWDLLPDAVLYAHTPPRMMEGLVKVERGDGFLSRLIGRLLRLPDAGDRRPIMVRMSLEEDGELWERWIQGRRYPSKLRPGAGYFLGLLVEQFGAVAVGVSLIWRAGRLEFQPRRWTLFGLPMPDSLVPGGASFECEINGDFCFHIEITHQWIGLLIRYSGKLAPIQ
jgi:hypothetical protein